MLNYCIEQPMEAATLLAAWQNWPGPEKPSLCEWTSIFTSRRDCQFTWARFHAAVFKGPMPHPETHQVRLHFSKD